ncbi:MAG TPA: TIM-barrel domain-containing protein [Sedimentisphaerales bacterium]|nr:TIM-barrel domain-containing protein [Sedimentisphaerales bacterium]
MRQANDFMMDMLDMDAPSAAADTIWRACRPTDVREQNGEVFIAVPFQAQARGSKLAPDESVPRRQHELRLRAYGGGAVRISIAFAGQIPEESPMLDWHGTMKRENLSAKRTKRGWDIADESGALRARLIIVDEKIRPWPSGMEMSLPGELLKIELFPDGQTSVPMMSCDAFTPSKHESFSLAYIERDGTPRRAAWSFHAEPGEKFAGAGERFAKMDLAGRTLKLENKDALGVNNRRAYKNVPFYLSSRPYGLFVHSSAHMRLSLADVSTRAAQGLVEEPAIDLFVIGGGAVERVLYNYRRITGFPPEVPLWTLGTWMSRMTYFSAGEVRQIARRLREERFPCDVLHIDTGWFAKNWICEWQFSRERFPDPAAFMAEMKEMGYRITLWQNPNVSKQAQMREEAIANRYVAPKKSGSAASTASDFSQQEFTGAIDFSNPAAVKWYQGLLATLLKMGTAAIKTDFGEEISLDGDYVMPAEKLHNLYCLLYQRAAYEVTKEITGQGFNWARAGWAGCQRYPVHWGGDAASSWDGMAGSLRGGLHIGLSGFGYWSHDIPGFHGLPDFMSSWPTDELYVRWTQFGVFTSHMRYHGTTPREPYEYPKVADIVRQWLKLRYALIPYIVEQGKKTARTGYPILRAFVFDFENDPLCWHIDDQYCFGDSLLVAPVMNDRRTRDVYLPAGDWVDFWTGRKLKGGKWLRNVKTPLRRMPLYAKRDAKIPVYPCEVQCTDQMDMRKCVDLVFDGSYKGLSGSPLGSLINL